MLKINILSIAGIGLLMLLTGLLLFVFQDSIAQHRRFFLPIPPLGVAAYVFVFNLFDHYNGKLPESSWLPAADRQYQSAQVMPWRCDAAIDIRVLWHASCEENFGGSPWQTTKMMR